MANEFKAKNGLITPVVTANVAIGTVPLVITSTTLCNNLNADYLDNQHGSYYAPVNNATMTGSFTASATTENIDIGNSQSSGVITIGGAAAGGNIVLGRSTNSQTVSVASAALASGQTRSINIGTSGLSGSTTNIYIGAATADTSTTAIRGAVALAATTENINIGVNQTTGAIAIGGSSGTNTIDVGRSTDTQTVSIAGGATANTKTKTLNIGTGGVSGSTTNIVIGTATSGAASNVNVQATSLSIPAGTVLKKAGTGNLEGGEIVFEKGDTSSLTGNLVVDLYNNGLRFWDSSTTVGVNLNFTAGVAGATSNIALFSDILSFKTISVSGQSDIVADSSADTLTLVAGTGISLTTNASTDTLTITSTSSGATITNDTSTNATYYPVASSATSGSLSTAYTSSTKYTYNPSTGNLSATQFTSLSDKSKKKNISTIKNALDKVEQLRGVSFDWIDNNKSSIGLIAQEVEQVIPEVVETTYHSDDTIHYEEKSVSYGNIVGLLIEAIKEQQQQIDWLTAQLTKDKYR
jgi:putative lipoic acid-binding regulatory protein